MFYRVVKNENPKTLELRDITQTNITIYVYSYILKIICDRKIANSKTPP